MAADELTELLRGHRFFVRKARSDPPAFESGHDRADIRPRRHAEGRSEERPLKDLKDVPADGPPHLRQALIKNGYADHFLQDSFAAGHLVNKTLVMQWWVEFVNDDKRREERMYPEGGRAPLWPGELDRDVLAAMTTERQPRKSKPQSATKARSSSHHPSIPGASPIRKVDAIQSAKSPVRWALSMSEMRPPSEAATSGPETDLRVSVKACRNGRSASAPCTARLNSSTFSAAMPASLILSSIVAVLITAAVAIGFSGLRRGARA